METGGNRQRLTVELSEETMEILQQRVAESGCADASEYLDNLVHADLTREQKQHLERLLIESIESGPPLPMDDAYWADLHKRVQARIAAKGRSAA
ncbi:MAG: hypothetical protein ACKVZJ_12770 [Phycisphaerales bacterium]